MTTYTIAVNDLEGVIIRFQAHPNPSFPFFRHTLNSIYCVDLYDTDFHFLFDVVPTNEHTELFKDAPKQLLDYMIGHIKTESGSVGTQSKTDKVETLFKTIQLSYKMQNNRVMIFIRGQELASDIQHFLKHQRDDVPTKCTEILLLTTRIYPSPIGIVDGLNMDKLFSSKQAIPAPTTPTAAATARTHLATIATTMSTAVSGVTSKAAANHADADKDETIDYKDMPADVHARYDLKNHLINIITISVLKPFHNDLTVDKYNSKQR